MFIMDCALPKSIQFPTVTEDTLENIPQEYEHRGRSNISIYLSILVSISVIAAVLLAILNGIPTENILSPKPFSSDAAYYSPIFHQNPPVTSCGRTREEALSRDCTFDVLASAWLPPLCYDSELVQLSQAENATFAESWFQDRNHTLPISQDKLWSLDGMTAYTWETFHVAHCLYKWRWLLKATKMIREGAKTVWVHDQIISDSHVKHCGEVLADQAHRIGAKADVQFVFGKCARLDLVN